MWNGFIVHHRFRETIYYIKVMQKQAGEKKAATVTVDGVVESEKAIALVDDDQE